MAPVFQFSELTEGTSVSAMPSVKVAWGTQATWRHVHVGLKSAPQHRDFRPEKGRVI
jgi:hypothetical protein